MPKSYIFFCQKTTKILDIYKEAYIIYEGERINLESCISSSNNEYKYVSMNDTADYLHEIGKIKNSYDISGTIQKFELVKNGKSYFANLKIKVMPV